MRYVSLPRKKALVIFFAVYMSTLPPAFGWSRVGHQTVALIAERRLSKTALDQVHAILGPGVGLADIAGCADNIKRRPIKCADAFNVSRNPTSRTWHYINIPVKDSPDVGTIMDYCRIHGKAKGCIIDEINKGLRILKDPAATRAEKQIALMFVVHFVGDLHMPLHNAFGVDAKGRSDGGGNGAEVWFLQSPRAKRPTNLHHVWDNMLESDSTLKKTGAVAYADRLESDMRGKDVSVWLKSDLAAASLESFAIAKTLIYPAYRAPGGKRPGKEYQERMQPIAFEQVEKAGARLADALEKALAP